MRVISAMMQNTMLLNTNRNMRRLDSIYMQLQSTKKIQRPSDNPLISARSLKFRTNMTENQDFQNNVDSGLAWMDVTEAALDNVTARLLHQIRDRLVEGATGTNQLEDRQVFLGQISSLLDQIGLEMNASFAGRYVFSGWRTDQPPTFSQNNTLSFSITQQFSRAHMEQARSFQVMRPGPNDPLPSAESIAPIVREINILKLAYRTIDVNAGQNPAGGPVIPGVPGTLIPPVPGTPTTGGSTAIGIPQIQLPPPFEVHMFSVNDYYAYLPCRGIPPTLPNPAFPATIPNPAYILGQPNPGIPATIVNPLHVPGAPPMLENPDFIAVRNIVHLIQETGELVFTAEAAANFPLEPQDITYTRTGFNIGDLNPVVYFTTTQKLTHFSELGRFPEQAGVAFNPAIVPPTVQFPLEVIPGYDVVQLVSANNNRVQLAYRGMDMDGMTFHFPGQVDALGQPVNASMLDPTAPPPIPPALPATIDFFQTLSPTPGVPPTAAAIAALADGEVMFDPDTGILWMNNNTAAAFRGVEVHYEKDTFERTDVVPTANPLVRATGPRLVGHDFDMEDQLKIYQFGSNTVLPVNTLAKNVFTDKLYADLRRLVDFGNSLEPTCRDLLREIYSAQFGLTGEMLEQRVDQHLSDERARFNYAIFNRFNNMLHLIDGHISNATREHTDLGSRGRRLELLQNRLEQDEGSLFRLLSRNEDVDITQVLVAQSSAEAAYMASLRVGMHIIQTTMMNFIGSR